MSECLSFLRLNNIPLLCIYHIFLVCPLMDTKVALTCRLVNNAAMNMAVQISWRSCFNDFAYISRSKSAGLHYNFIFNLGGTTTLFSVVAALFYIAIKISLGLQFIHIPVIFVIFCFFLSFLFWDRVLLSPRLECSGGISAHFNLCLPASNNTLPWPPE